MEAGELEAGELEAFPLKIWNTMRWPFSPLLLNMVLEVLPRDVCKEKELREHSLGGGRQAVSADGMVVQKLPPRGY